jgi:hypothetical protein
MNLLNLQRPVQHPCVGPAASPSHRTTLVSVSPLSFLFLLFWVPRSIPTPRGLHQRPTAAHGGCVSSPRGERRRAAGGELPGEQRCALLALPRGDLGEEPPRGVATAAPSPGQVSGSAGGSLVFFFCFFWFCHTFSKSFLFVVLDFSKFYFSSNFFENLFPQSVVLKFFSRKFLQNLVSQIFEIISCYINQSPMTY